VYNNFVSGKYISQEGNYLVSDFSDSSSFDKIVSEINSKQFVNLEEPISNWITIEKTNPKYYNPIDCDSKKFIEDLKKCGRIIVSSSQTSKDELLEKTNLYINENNKLKQNLNTKNKEIEQLNNNIKSLNQKIDNLQNSINSSSISHDQDIKSLKDEIEKAKEEKRKIEAELSNQKTKYDKLEKEYNKLKKNIGSGVVPAEPKVQELAKYCATMPKKKNLTRTILMFSQLILTIVTLVFLVYLFFAIPSKKIR
jgi:myosin heavy subunit